jgi:hypothetical protein
MVLVFLFAVLALCILSSPGPARAGEPVLVLLLRPIQAGQILTEAILRIKSELLAGGFEVVVADVDGAELGPDPRALMERAGQALAPSATIGIVGDLDQGSAELWVVDRITGKTVIQRLEVQTSSDRRIPEVLAIRAQELLRASLVGFLLAENRPNPTIAAPPPQVPRWVKQGMESRLQPWTLGLDLGASMFGGWGGVGPALAPIARLRVALDGRFWTRVTGLGLGTRPRVGDAAIGSASVSRNLLLFEFAAWLRPGRPVRPLFSLGFGAQRIAVEGTASLPYQGQSNARWFAVGDVGTGVALRLQAHWEVQLEAHALFSAPRPAIRFFDAEVARVGQPTLLAILTLAGGA